MKNNIIFNRIWAMPNKHTFLIKPIKELLNKYVKDGKNWIDPFAGNNSPAEFTNDLNPNANTKEHLEAINFINKFKRKFNGCLFDPPYSPRQIKECYNSIGLKLSMKDTQSTFWSETKNNLAFRIVKNGYVICCGWNTNGFGKNRGFELVEILLIPHGGHHNDTIVTVERKIK